LCVDDDDGLELDRRGMRVLGGAILTKTLHIPVCLEWFYYEGSGAGEQWAMDPQRSVENPVNGIRMVRKK
jgi:hypothetical protein